MPSVFLSPSTQGYNEYITGGTEKEYMNRLADAMEPFLDLAGISYGRNDPNGDVRTSVAISNEGDYDLHLALHSNASPQGQVGENQGPLVMYYPGNAAGERAAEYEAQSLADIYPEDGKVVLRPETNLYELRETKAPTVFIEVAYHDNPEDAEWIESATVAIADHLTQGLAEYFGLPYARQDEPQQAVVHLNEGHLNVRRLPGIEYQRVGKLENGESVTVLRRIPGWSYVRLPSGNAGYAASQYLRTV
ncbi:MAG: N-acetylmuramoyl-L-alanine amidase [Oscillospiraceae bacterium]|jgi:N-acetylmuramoyl-L-alanine amidase|nr:N-acetylmuramoyl-L-alanine amidase [Oscillospiraceae bacterium]